MDIAKIVASAIEARTGGSMAELPQEIRDGLAAIACGPAGSAKLPRMIALVDRWLDGGVEAPERTPEEMRKIVFGRTTDNPKI